MINRRSTHRLAVATISLVVVATGCLPTLTPGSVRDVTEPPSGPAQIVVGESSVCAVVPQVGGLTVSSSGTVYFSTAVGYSSVVDDHTRVYKIASGNLAVSLVAGNGVSGFAGDGGAAKAAELRRPTGLWIDSTGLFIADTGDNRVRKVNGASGVITTVAGNGHTGRSSNVVATKALLEAPTAVRTNGSGGLEIGNRFGGAYVNLTTRALTATSTHGPIFAVDPSNNTYSVAASVAHPATDLAPVVRYANHTTTPVPYLGTTTPAGSSVDGAPAVSAWLPDSITSLATNPAGDLYYSGGGGSFDPVDSAIRYVDPATKTLHTVSGFDGWAINQETLVTVAPNGDLYATADRDTEILRRDHTTGTVTLIAGGADDTAHCGGRAIRWYPPSPVASLAHDTAGDVFLATAEVATLSAGYRTPQLWEIGPDGSITAIEDNGGPVGVTGDEGPVSAATFSSIEQLAVDPAGDLFIADGPTVRRVDHLSHQIDTIAGTGAEGDTGDGGPATAAELRNVRGLTADATGNVYIGEATSDVATGKVARLRRVDHATGIITTVAGGPTASVTPTAAGVAADTAAIELNQLTADSSGSVYFGDGTAAYRYNPPTPAHPTGTVTLLAGTPDPSGGGSLAVEPDAAGDVFLTDNRSITRLDHGTLAPHTIYVFDPTPLEAFPGGYPHPYGMLVTTSVVGNNVDFGYHLQAGTGLDLGSGVRQVVDATHAPDNPTPR